MNNLIAMNMQPRFDLEKFLTTEEVEIFKKNAKEAERTPTEHLKALIVADLKSSTLSETSSN